FGLMEVAVRVIRIPFLNKVRIGLLRVFIDANRARTVNPAVAPIQKEVMITPIVKRHIYLVDHPKESLLANPSVVTAKVRRQIQHKIVLPKEQLVIGKGDCIIRAAPERPAIACPMERAAAKKRAHVINNALVVIDKGGVERFVAGSLASRPAVNVSLRQPN